MASHALARGWPRSAATAHRIRQNLGNQKNAITLIGNHAPNRSLIAVEFGRIDQRHAEALCTGIALGMSLIDTAELYGNEEFIGRVIADQRDRVFLVSKILPKNAIGDGIARACEASLGRLKTDHLDLYLLHWREATTDLSSVVAAFEGLRNDRQDSRLGRLKLQRPGHGRPFPYSTRRPLRHNQVRYNLNDRNVERGLLPWCVRHGMPVMAYSPLGGSDSNLLRDPTLARIAEAHACSAAAVALAWLIRGGNVIAIPESGSPAHVKENAVALSLTLTPDEIQAMNAAYPLRDR